MKADVSADGLRDEVLGWLENEQWKGFDPFDGLNSTLFSFLVDGPLASLPGAALVRLAVLQGVKRSPVDVRPFLLIKRQENAMTWAVGALGAACAALRGEVKAAERAKVAVTKMISLSGPENLWGYPFPWQARAFYLRPNEPNLVISAICLRALVDVYQHFVNKDFAFAESIRAQYRLSVNALVSRFYRPAEGFFSYVQHKAVLVHNANLLAIEAGFSSRKLRIELDPSLYQAFLAALDSTLVLQEESGRWSYGTSAHHAWGDNFHTAYNLVSLARTQECLSLPGEDAVNAKCISALKRGTSFYLSKAFTPSGSARYYDNETWPIETHSFAAALVCLSELNHRGWLEKDLAQRLSKQTICAAAKDVYLGNGAFAYRRWPRGKNRTVFTRWTQAWMYYGLEASLSLLAQSSLRSSSDHEDRTTR